MTAHIDERQEYVATERVAIILYEILDGRSELTTAEIAARCGMSNQGAHQMMGKVSRVIPLYQDKGVWRMMVNGNRV